MIDQLIIEDGTGIWNANAYTATSFVGVYLRRRGRATEWDAASLEKQASSVIAGTDFIDRRWGLRFLGTREFVNIKVPANSVCTLVSNPSNGETVQIDATVYTFRNAPLTTAFEVLIGVGGAAETAANLAAAIVADPQQTGVYGPGTTAHPTVLAENVSPDVFVQAITPGEDGNTIVTQASNPASAVWLGATLTGGSDTGEQALEFPRKSLFTRSGTRVLGVPRNVQAANAEYASRALTISLMPDPVLDESGRTIQEKEEQVGPVRERTVYEEGAALSQLLRPYPEADQLLREYIGPSGRVVRG